MSPGFALDLEETIERAARALLSVLASVPTERDLDDDMEAARAVAARGYFKPGEDERLRALFARYLRCRAALWDILDDLRHLQRQRPDLPRDAHLRLHAVGFCAGCALVRTARWLVRTFGRDAVLRRKLNEAEPRFGIPRKAFTDVYRSVTAGGTTSASATGCGTTGRTGPTSNVGAATR